MYIKVELKIQEAVRILFLIKYFLCQYYLLRPTSYNYIKYVEYIVAFLSYLLTQNVLSVL